MKSSPWFGLIIIAVSTLPASAEVTLNRSDDAVVLENMLVRVELRRDQNFQPSVLIDKRNLQASLIDDVGFLAWDVPRADWMTSATCDWVASVKTHEDDKAAWCETMLVQDLSNTKVGARARPNQPRGRRSGLPHPHRIVADHSVGSGARGRRRCSLRFHAGESDPRRPPTEVGNCLRSSRANTQVSLRPAATAPLRDDKDRFTSRS
ncbi:MAG: hypothetical protein CMJ64_27780 [Planctomycetaceae bacterium]|nr:hypothetical protein [Planctomycetaceae bacterium]